MNPKRSTLLTLSLTTLAFSTGILLTFLLSPRALTLLLAIAIAIAAIAILRLIR